MQTRCSTSVRPMLSWGRPVMRKWLHSPSIPHAIPWRARASLGASASHWSLWTPSRLHSGHSGKAHTRGCSATTGPRRMRSYPPMATMTPEDRPTPSQHKTKTWRTRIRRRRRRSTKNRQRDATIMRDTQQCVNVDQKACVHPEKGRPSKIKRHPRRLDCAPTTPPRGACPPHRHLA